MTTFAESSKMSWLWTYFLDIPPYQRDYVWKSDRFEEFWRPIIDKVKSRDPDEYGNDLDELDRVRLGAILLVHAHKRGDGVIPHYDIIDGQQRLTTVFLLALAIRAAYQKKGRPEAKCAVDRLLVETESNRLRLTPRRVSDQEGLAWIHANPWATDLEWKAAMRALGNRLGFRNLEKADSSVSAMWKMYKTFRARVEEECAHQPDLLRGLDQFVLRGLYVVPILSPNEQTALVDFERMNSNGVRLSSMDLLKGAIFARITPGSYTLVDDAVEGIRKVLTQDMHALGAFLRHYVVGGEPNWSLHAPVDESFALAHLRRLGAEGWPDRGIEPLFAPGQIKPFLWSLQTAAQTAARFHEKPHLGPSGPSLALAGIHRLKAQKLALAPVLAARHVPKPLFEDVMSSVEDALFVLMVSRVQAKQIERFLFNACRDIWRIQSPSDVVDFQRNIVSKIVAPSRHDFLGALRQYTLRPYGGPDRAKYLFEHLSVFIAKGGRRGALEDHQVFEKEWDLVLASQESIDPALFPEMRRDRLGNMVLLEKPKAVLSTTLPDRVQRLATSSSLLNSEWWGVPSRQLPAGIPVALRSSDWWGKGVVAREDWLIQLAEQRWIRPYI
jgi:hypothetical protein